MFVKSNILPFVTIKVIQIPNQKTNATLYHQTQQNPQFSITIN